MNKYINFFQIILLVLMIFIFNINFAEAHIPLDTTGSSTKSEPIKVNNHKISWAAYKSLNEGGQVDYYRFEAKKGEEIYAGMVIPLIDRLENFSPEFALIGPGLESDYSDFKKDKINNLLKIKPDEGIIVVKYEKEEKDVFFEPFTQTSYWRKQEFYINAPKTGIYHLAVFSVNNQTGKYTFTIGKQEKWGATNLIKLPKIWWDTRMFVEKRKSTYVITGAVTAGLLYLVSKLIK